MAKRERDARQFFVSVKAVFMPGTYLCPMKSQKNWAALAALLMALTVVLGALGAHALERVLEPAQLDSFNTGVRYMAWHALGILLVQLLPVHFASAKVQLWTSRLLLAGIICFSFSIFLLNLRFLLGIEKLAAVLGPITPIGGLLFIAGWLVLAIGILRSKSVNDTL